MKSHGVSRAVLATCAVVGVVGATSDAAAQISGDQLNTAFDIQRAQQVDQNTFSGFATFGRLDEDFFLNVTLRLSFDREYWGIGLQVPVRFRLIDNDPQDNDDIGSVIRKEDWDQPSDFLRLMRYVYVGKADKTGPFYVRLGELSNLSIGHGTIMHRYFNNFDISRWRAGLNAAVNIGAFGADVMVSDLLDWHVVGGRLSVRPLQLALGDGFWSRLVIGASVVADTKAPFELERQVDDPDTEFDESTRVRVNNQDEPEIAQSEAFVIAGVDIGLEVLTTDLLKITPYVDMNRMTFVENGWGLHAGVLWNLRLPMGFDTFITDLRTEYRYVSGDYISPYFNTVYEIERYNVLANEAPFPTPKLQCLASVTEPCSLNTGAAKNGFYFDVIAGWPNWIYIGGEYLDYDGDRPDGQLRLSLEVPALEFLQLSAFYYRVNVDGPSDLFALDDKSAVIAQAVIPIYSFISLQARWWRVWRADPDEGGYASVDDWSVGFGFSYSF